MQLKPHHGRRASLARPPAPRQSGTLVRLAFHPRRVYHKLMLAASLVLGLSACNSPGQLSSGSLDDIKRTQINQLRAECMAMLVERRAHSDAASLSGMPSPFMAMEDYCRERADALVW